MEFSGQTVGHQISSPIQAICSNVLFIVMGYYCAQLNSTMLPVIMGHTPAGASVRSLVHYAQGGVNSGEFRMYNYGKEGNLLHYGQEVSPKYDVSQISAPIALYWSDNDFLGTEHDFYRLAERLPNLQRKYRVPLEKFNHMDFMWAIDAVPLVWETMEAFMRYF